MTQDKRVEVVLKSIVSILELGGSVEELEERWRPIYTNAAQKALAAADAADAQAGIVRVDKRALIMCMGGALVQAGFSCRDAEGLTKSLMKVIVP